MRLTGTRRSVPQAGVISGSQSTEMVTERQWVHSLVPRIQAQFDQQKRKSQLVVRDDYRLTYAFEIQGHKPDGSPLHSMSHYETDIIVTEIDPEGVTIPRVVVECKKSRITTHTVQAYSTKAATHKTVYPYLRYGFLSGGRGHYGVPARLLRHGTEFDFLCTWRKLSPTPQELRSFVHLLRQEILASRKLQEIFTENRKRDKSRFTIVHRPLRVVE